MLHFRCSMLHRNMKPSNILIDAAGKLKLSDYGLTHVTSEGRCDQGVISLDCIDDHTIKSDKYMGQHNKMLIFWCSNNCVDLFARNLSLTKLRCSFARMSDND